PGPSAGGFVEQFDGATGVPVGYFQPFPGFEGGITTGQGVATLAAPFSTVFANPVAIPSGGMPAGSPGDAGDTSSDTGFVAPPDPAFVPPTDPGIATPAIPVATPPTDSGDTTPTDSGDSDAGSPCDCGDSGDVGDPVDPGDPGNIGTPDDTD